MPHIIVEVSEREAEEIRRVRERAEALQRTMRDSFGMEIGLRACTEAVVMFSPEFRR